MASPFTNQQQQKTWVPYEPTRDCSQGFCSIYCPQWCYIIFPPPPPFSFSDDDDDSSSGDGGPTFSPLVIAIIGILASAFLLVSYYTIISKYCGGFRSRSSNRRPRSRQDPPSSVSPTAAADAQPQAWHDSPSSEGLDEALISKITLCKYKRGDRLVECTDCSVCLSEFRDDESLRLLPKCSHAFHVQCIDTWLRSHSNCPLCRASIVPFCPSPAPQAPESGGEVAVVVRDLDEAEMEHDSYESKDEPSEGHHAVEIVEEGGDGEDVQPTRISIADILQVSMEDELTKAKDLGSCSRERGVNSKVGERSRRLHGVMSPVQMKRSMSSGRLGLPRQGRGRNSVLPARGNV